MKNTFKEQKGIPKFILIIFIIQFLVFLGFYFKNQEDKSLIYFIIGIIVIGIILAFTKLTLEISKDKIQYRFSPFPTRTIKWSEIDTYSIIKLSALSDFLGWGVRYSKKYGKGYIIETDYALFLKTKKGKKITISIQNKELLEKYLTDNQLNN
ncbi:hypothetical protein [Tenacibaculum maritimum]|uniref:hypothetical protein n=1 Tax=Tenacibaculum maritimum TaxID=107401 RepID=UPI0012E68F39|nr:hypothetical protein [Tenacibaculum maritimum]CAA0236276.1 conserved hypothetical protein [Tenacibaculum maritimum]